MRKTAVIGCIKLAMVSHDAVFGTDLVDTLYKMLRDRDPQVVANCIVALDEILKAEGGMVINKQIIHHLLNRVKEFNEWSQCIVLEKVAHYKPAEQARRTPAHPRATRATRATPAPPAPPPRHPRHPPRAQRHPPTRMKTRRSRRARARLPFRAE